MIATNKSQQSSDPQIGGSLELCGAPDGDLGSVDDGRAVTGEEVDDVGDLIGFRPVHVVGIGECSPRALGIDHRWHEHVACDVRVREFPGDRLRKCNDTGLGNVVCGLSRRSIDGLSAAEHDDPAPFLVPHVGNRGTDCVERRSEIQIDHAVEAHVVGLVHIAAAGPAANETNEDVEAAERVDRLLDESVHRGWINGINTPQEELILVKVECALEPGGLLGDDVGNPELEIPLDQQGDQCSTDRAGSPSDDGDIRSGHGPTLAMRPLRGCLLAPRRFELLRCVESHPELPKESAVAEIKLEDIGKIYPDGTRAVGEVTLTINDGEFLVLVGPSGCGKSTVLRMIAGLEEISEGKMYIGDTLVNDVAPKDRDIAMVFQNYALYPHMTVFDNMAFGLKLRKTPKDEIKRRVDDAAEVLEITEFLDRKPKALSGGQRQRVAMGRAIVREPSAFLMDEPLSNLDAKLRVAMRTELGRLHLRLGTTTVYVTHDQVEAMTLGHRVAVLQAVTAKRPYNLAQVAPPTELFNNPANLFVAGFIGSPAMNMVYGELEQESEGRVYLKFADKRVYVETEALHSHPGIENYYGKKIVVGIRPGLFEDARAAENPVHERTITVNTDVNELLGSESYVHFGLDEAPVITPDIEELLADTGTDAETLGHETRFTARVSPDVPVPDGSDIDLIIDTSKLHFFDLDTSNKIGYAPRVY